MVENNETHRGWFHSLFRITNACVFGIVSLALIEQLIDEVMWISEQYKKRKLETELEIEKVCDEFRKALEDAYEKEYNDSVEECLGSIRKGLEAEVEKKDSANKKVYSDSLEECLSGARKVLEASFEDRKRGIVNDEKLHSDVKECFTDFKKVLGVAAK